MNDGSEPLLPNLVLDSYSLIPHPTKKSMSRHFHVQMPEKLRDFFFFFSQIFCTNYTGYMRREETVNRASKRFKMRLHTTLKKLWQSDLFPVSRDKLQF